MTMPLRILSICTVLGLGAGFSFSIPADAKNPVSSGTAQSKQQALKLYRSGVSKSKRNDNRGAVVDLSNFLLLNPNNAGASYERAIAYFRLGKLPEAKADLERAILLRPKWAEAHSKYGSVLSELGDRQKAVESIQKARKFNPRSITVLNASYLFNQFEGNPKESTRDAKALIASTPRDAAEFALRAQCRRFNGDIKGALADVDKAIALEPDLYLVHIIRPQILIDLNRYEEAFRSAQASARLCPTDPWNFLLMGQIKLFREGDEAAFACYEKAIAIDAMNSLPSIANILAYNGHSSALRYIERGLKLMPSNATLRHARAMVLCRTGRAREATIDADFAYKSEPRNSQFALRSGEAHYLSGDQKGGILGFERALAINPKAHFEWVVNFLSKRDSRLALSYAHRAISLMPDRASLYACRARLHYAMNDKAGAISDADVALKLQPEFMLNARSIRIYSFAELGKYDLALAAIADYEKVSSLPLRIEHMKAKLLIAKGNYVAAKITLDQSLAGYPCAYAYLLRSTANRHLGHCEDAIADARAAMKLHEGSISKGLREISLAHLQQGNFLAAPPEFMASLLADITVD